MYNTTIMQFQTDFFRTKNFLKTHEKIWNHEILQGYPHKISDYPKDWICDLESIDQKGLWRIDTNSDFSQISNDSLLRLIKEINQLAHVMEAEVPPLKKIPLNAYFRVNAKKLHEVKTLVPVIGRLNEKIHFKNAIDIGGGKGHLARFLAHYYGIKCVSLDNDKNLQAAGKKRLTKIEAPKDAKEIKFININYQKECDLGDIFTKDSLSVGLHTCGPLAIKQLKDSIQYKVKGLINFGCCYYRLDPVTECNISKTSSLEPLQIGLAGLTLATRSRVKISFEEFKLKQRVKYYRYALHLLHYHHLGIKEFISVGDSKARLYYEEFSTYALLKLNHLKIKHNLSSKQIDDFYNCKETQKKIQEMFFANIIRWRFGRLVEYYILLDRALFLEESGYQVKINTFFDQKISPRNIGIIATTC